jgi:hypothetical protein
MDEEYGHIPDGFFLSQEEVEELHNKKHTLTQYGKQRLKELKMKQIAQKCVASARNVAEGNPTLGKLIQEGRDPMIAKTYYEFAAVIREAVNELQYYHFGDGEDMVVSARALYELANELEVL